MYFPFHQNEDVTTIDQYLVCGEHYKTIRNAVAKGVMEGKADGFDETCEVMFCSEHHLRTLDIIQTCVACSDWTRSSRHLQLLKPLPHLTRGYAEAI